MRTERMKFFLIYCAIVATAFTLADSTSVSIEIDTKEDELRAEYCDFPKHSPFRRECALFKCSKDRARVLAIPCPYSPCSNKLSYNEEEFSRPYPECCPPKDC